MEEEQIDYNLPNPYADGKVDEKLGKEQIEKCSEIIDDGKGNKYKIIYLDYFHRPVVKEKAKYEYKKRLTIE